MIKEETLALKSMRTTHLEGRKEDQIQHIVALPPCFCQISAWRTGQQFHLTCSFNVSVFSGEKLRKDDLNAVLRGAVVNTICLKMLDHKHNFPVNVSVLEDNKTLCWG